MYDDVQTTASRLTPNSSSFERMAILKKSILNHPQQLFTKGTPAALLLILLFHCLCLLQDLLYISIAPEKFEGKMEKDQQYMVIKRIFTSWFLKGMVFFVRGVTLGALKGKTTNSASLFFIIK